MDNGARARNPTTANELCAFVLVLRDGSPDREALTMPHRRFNKWLPNGFRVILAVFVLLREG